MPKHNRRKSHKKGANRRKNEETASTEVQDSTSVRPKLFEPVTEVVPYIIERINVNPGFRSALAASLERYHLNHTQNGQTKQMWSQIQHLAGFLPSSTTSDMTSSQASQLSRQDVFRQNMAAYTGYRSRALGWRDARADLQDRIKAESITAEEASEICMLLFNIIKCGRQIEEEVFLQNSSLDRCQLQDTILGFSLSSPPPLPQGVQQGGEKGKQDVGEPACVHNVLMGVATSNLSLVSLAAFSSVSAAATPTTAPVAPVASVAPASPWEDANVFVRSFHTFDRRPGQLAPSLVFPDVRLALLQWLWDLLEQDKTCPAGKIHTVANDGYQFWGSESGPRASRSSSKPVLSAEWASLLVSSLSEEDAQTIAVFVEAVRQRQHLFSRAEGWLATQGKRFVSPSPECNDSHNTGMNVTILEAEFLLGILSELVDVQLVINSTVKAQLYLQVQVVVTEYAATISPPPAPASGLAPIDNRRPCSAKIFHYHQNIRSLERCYTRLLTGYSPEYTPVGRKKRALMNAYLAGSGQLRRVYAAMSLFLVDTADEVHCSHRDSRNGRDSRDSHSQGEANVNVNVNINVSEDIAKQAWLLLAERKAAYDTINQAVEQMQVLRKASPVLAV